MLKTNRASKLYYYGFEDLVNVYYLFHQPANDAHLSVPSPLPESVGILFHSYQVRGGRGGEGVSERDQGRQAGGNIGERERERGTTSTPTLPLSPSTSPGIWF